jgi:FO synthase
VTYLRVRPAAEVNEIAARTRRREGTTALEFADPRPEDLRIALSGGLLPVVIGSADVQAAAWVAEPAAALELAKRGVAWWRLTVLDEGPRADVLDAVARTRAAHLRTGRSRVEEAVSIAELPGITTEVSVFVDTVADALDAVASGASDLLLRDWETGQIGELRDSLDRPLVERTAVPVGITVDTARATFDPGIFTAYLNLVDGAGAARPGYTWAPGMNEAPPIPAGRLSAQWLDAAWVQGQPPEQLAGASKPIRAILERSLVDQAPTRDEIETLFSSRGNDLDAIAWTADQLRRRRVGDRVTYVVNRNINYTNLCYFKCGFCAFSKGPKSLNLRGDPYLMTVDDVVEKSVEAWERGATEVCLQGGIHPEFTGQFYVDVLAGIKQALPDMHVHGFTPLEVWQGAETLGMTVKDFLVMLKDAGLGTLPGTAAEILDDDVRQFLCPDKIRTSQWAEVMITAHQLGLRSTATIMFGHIDSPVSWANHYEVLRDVQRRTGGITEIVPLPFVHMGAPIYLRGLARPGPTWDEIVLMHSVARLAFDGLVDNIQASWVKLGLTGGARLLEAGCNDLGGTLMNETISRAAGASHGQEVTPTDFERLITSAGREPARRTTLYGIIDQVTTQEGHHAGS